MTELEDLRAWKAEIEKQEPVVWMHTVCGKTFFKHYQSNYPLFPESPLFAAPVVSPDVEKLKAEIRELRMSRSLRQGQHEHEVQSLKVELAKATRELEAARKDAESWRSYKKRKDEVIAAGMGRNILRDAAIEQAKSCNELHEKGSV